jgi:hypothetical protein
LAEALVFLSEGFNCVAFSVVPLLVVSVLSR